MEMPGKCFVSYSHQDASWVNQVVNRLIEAGFKFWIDRISLDGAALWGEEIVKAIVDCPALLFFASTSSIESRFIIREIAIAVEEDKPVIPVIIDNIKYPDALRFFLSQYQSIECFDRDPAAAAEAILRALQAKGIAAGKENIKQQSSDDKEKSRLGDTVSFTEAYARQVINSSKYLLPDGVDYRPGSTEKQFVSRSLVEVDYLHNPQQFSEIVNRCCGDEHELAVISSDQLLLERSDHILLLGEGGSGKSTLLYKIANSLARRSCIHDNTDNADINLPILIQLANMHLHNHLLESLIESLVTVAQYPSTSAQSVKLLAEDTIRQAIDSQRLCILFDGLDELSIEERVRTLEIIARYSESEYGRKTKIILSSRLLPVLELIKIESTFAQYLLLPLRDEEYRQYICSWLSVLKGSESDAAGLSEQFQGILERINLGKLSRNPLILKIALVVWAHGEKIGDKRSDLIDRYLFSVIPTREKLRRPGQRMWSRSKLERVLKRIAIAMLEREELTINKALELVEKTEPEDPEGMIWYLTERLSILTVRQYRAYERFAFSHNLMLDYFAAKAVIDLLQERSKQQPPISDSIVSFINEMAPEHVRPSSSESAEFIEVSGGPFIFGKAESVCISDIPQPFSLMRTPVTNAQYYEYIKQTGRKPPMHWRDGKPSQDQLEHPVVYVSWHDANNYARWMKMRLPTEQEWERAARGVFGTRFPWGNEFLPGCCNSSESHINTTTAVGSYSPAGDSEDGIADLAGNVLEWTSSVLEGNSMILKGGSYCRAAIYEVSLDSAESSSRLAYLPGVRHRNIGFRLVCGGALVGGTPAQEAVRSDSVAQDPLLDGDLSGLVSAYVCGAARSMPVTEEFRKEVFTHFCVSTAKKQVSISAQGCPNGMVYIPAGPFIMGGEEVGNEQIRICSIDDGYWIDIHPVTNREYRKFLDWHKQTGSHEFCHPHEPKEKNHDPDIEYSQREPAMSDQYFTDERFDSHPVVNIDWWDAYAYACWAGKRLPFEAEWEKAARGCDGRIYPFGDVYINGITNSQNGSWHQPTAVGAFSASTSPCGCQDMAGNVWEWCQDFMDLEARSEYTPRVIRGGSFNSNEIKIRSAYRNGRHPCERWICIGFRCVKQDPNADGREDI